MKTFFYWCRDIRVLMIGIVLLMEVESAADSQRATIRDRTPYAVKQKVVADDCRLTYDYFFPYTAGIHCSEKGAGFARGGALLTTSAVISTCRGFPDDRTDCNAYLMRNDRKSGNAPCVSKHSVRWALFHPKCNAEVEDTKGMQFDFAILIITSLATFTSPPLPLPSTAYELMTFIRLANRGNISTCTIPHFTSPGSVERHDWGLQQKNDYTVMALQSHCAVNYCGGTGTTEDQQFADGKLRCERKILNYGFESTLCLAPRWTSTLSDRDKSWMGSAALCEYVGVGIASEIVKRWSPHPHFVYVLTFLRVWPWILTQKYKNVVKKDPFGTDTVTSDPWNVTVWSRHSAGTWKRSQFFHYVLAAIILIVLHA